MLNPGHTSAPQVSSPSAVAWGPNRLDVFGVGNDGILYHFWFDNGSWAGPDPLGGDITAAPTVLAPAVNQLHVLKPSSSSQLQHNWWDGTKWTGWRAVGGYSVGLPSRYRFSVDFVNVDTARSLNADTDTAQYSVTPGNWSTQTVTQFMGDVGGTHPKLSQTNLLHFDRVTVDLCESVIFNYQIVNKGNPNPDVVDKALNKAAHILADEALKDIAKQLGAGITAITDIQIGALSAVPVIGSILGMVEQWLLSQLEEIIFANCDGLVAVEQVVLMGRDLHLKTANGPYRVTTVHPGTDSATGCGANSKYEVSWSISRD